MTQAARKVAGTDNKFEKLITPEFRVSFPAIFEPKGFENQEAKYSIVMLFPKKTDLSSLKALAVRAGEKKFGPKKDWPKTIRWPFKDGDTKAEMDGYADHFYVNASSKLRVGLVDQSRKPIISEDDFYAGCYARAELTCYAYDKAGNKGISFGLQNIQKLRDGQPFSGRKAAEDVFDVVEDSSESAASYEDDGLGFN